MARTLDASTIFDTLEVKLEGDLYRLRELTRSVSSKLTAAQKKAREMQADPDTGDDEAAAGLIKILDVLLAPIGDQTSAEHLKRLAIVDFEDAAGNVDDELGALARLLTGRWKDDKLGADWLAAFTQTLQEEAEQRRRPTSTRTNSA